MEQFAYQLIAVLSGIWLCIVIRLIHETAIIKPQKGDK